MSRTHGTISAYNGGCRCTGCRAASAAYRKRQRRANGLRIKADPSLAQHGSASTYRNWDCRCGLCTAANRADCADYQARRRARVDA